jgi:hypothetical protein
MNNATINAMNEILSAKQSFIKRATVGNIVKADVTGAGEWHCGPILSVSKTSIEFHSERDGQPITIVRDEVMKCPRSDYEAVVGLLKQDEDYAIDADEDAKEEVEDAAEQFEDEDELEDGGSVVKPKYRELYRERGNPNHCGDWLALQLDGVFINEDEEFDYRKFLRFLENNDVAITGKWCDLSKLERPGFIGRLRMNGRQKLERALLQTGILTMPNGDQIELSEWFLKGLADKYPSLAS